MRSLSPDDGNTADRTVVAVPLLRPVGPNDTIDLDIEWSAKIPRPFSRTGYVDNYYFFGQWFPKLGVLEDAGWNTHQFHAGTEFYSDYGVYDVRMSVPRGYIVGASGREVSITDGPAATSIHRYHGDDIHDFAWTTSPDFLVRTRTFEHPTLPRVQMKLLLRRDHSAQEARHFDAAAATLKYYGEWFGPYQYDYLTIVDPAFQSASGGMEYPTLFTAGTRWIAPTHAIDVEEVTIHEAGHQWWYGAVGSNEFEHAWMDEGINQFSEARTDEAAFGDRNYLTRRYFGGFIPWVFRDIKVKREWDEGLAGYRREAESDAEATPSFRYWPSTDVHVLRTVEVPASTACGCLSGHQRVSGTRPDAVLRSGLSRVEHVRLRRPDADEHHRRRRQIPHDRRRTPLRRSDLPRRCHDDVCRWFAEDRALGRRRAPGDVRL